MAFTLQIRQKKLFRKTVLDAAALAKVCGFRYGVKNEFYILQEGEQNQGMAVFYNPACIGRGIFFNGARAGEGLYEIRHNIPSTPTEIRDFIRLAGEIKRRLGRIEMYCVEEERFYTVRELEQEADEFIAFSLESLHQFCGNKEYDRILTLARWPYTLPEEQADAWTCCTDLSDFQQTLHQIQSQEIYYANPRLMQEEGTGEIHAFYALTEECDSVFPVRADGFLNLDEMKASKGFIRFALYSERRALEGVYSYERFMEEIQRYEIRPFDKDHIRILPLTKEKLKELAAKLSS